MSVHKKYFQDPLFLYNLARVIESYLRGKSISYLQSGSEELIPLTNEEQAQYGSKDYYLARLYIMEAFRENPPKIRVSKTNKPFDFVDFCAVNMICPDFQKQSDAHPFDGKNVFDHSFIVDQVRLQPDYSINLLGKYYAYMKLPRTNVLHLGCGWGTLSHLLKGIFAHGFLTDLDICDKMLSYSPADKKVNDDAVKFMHQNPNRYDVITCHGLLRYIPPAANGDFLKAVQTVVKPGGYFLISEVDNPKNKIADLPVETCDGFVKIHSLCSVFRNSVFYKSAFKYHEDAQFHDEVNRVATRFGKAPSQILADMSGYKKATQSLIVGRVRG